MKDGDVLEKIRRSLWLEEESMGWGINVFGARLLGALGIQFEIFER